MSTITKSTKTAPVAEVATEPAPAVLAAPAPPRVSFGAVVAEVTNTLPDGLPGGPVLQRGGPLLRQVIDDLAAAGVTVPEAVTRALDLDGEIAAALAPAPPVAAWLAQQDLSGLSGSDVAERILDQAITGGAERGLIVGEVATVLLERASAALYDALDDVVAALRPQWDPAAMVLADAAAAGMHSEITTDEILESDTLIGHWRRLGDAVATLDRLDRLYQRVLLVAGVKLGVDERARRGRAEWLAASTDGPVRLLGPAERPAPELTLDELGNERPRIGRWGRSGTATEVHLELTAGFEAKQAAEFEQRAAARHADIAGYPHAAPAATTDDTDTDTLGEIA